MGALKTPAILIFVVGFLTYAMYESASAAERGEHHVASGRRAGVKQLVINAGEAVGPTGTLAIGGLLELALVGWIVAIVRGGGSDE